MRANPILPAIEAVGEAAVRQRFHATVCVAGDCWEWTGPRARQGYGRISIAGKTYPAHRASYVLHTGQDVPSHLCVCHACDNPPCVNPDHLWIGTVADNTADMCSKGRKVVSDRRGALNPKAKLTEDDVREIRARKMTRREQARKFGVAFGTIRDVRDGRCWRDVK